MSIPNLLECLLFMYREQIIDTNFVIEKIFPCLTDTQLQELQNLCFLRSDELSEKLNNNIRRTKLTVEP